MKLCHVWMMRTKNVQCTLYASIPSDLMRMQPIESLEIAIDVGKHLFKICPLTHTFKDNPCKFLV